MFFPISDLMLILDWDDKLKVKKPLMITIWVWIWAGSAGFEPQQGLEIEKNIIPYFYFYLKKIDLGVVCSQCLIRESTEL